jgi:alkylresorcinol/alkylpyrone synthase
MGNVAAVATSLPEHRLKQSELRDIADAFLPDTPGKAGALEVFDNARIEQRALAMPVEWYMEPHGFKDRTDAYLEIGTQLVESAARQALDEAGLDPKELGGVVMVSTTGMATPSLEARLANRLGLRPDLIRLPVWGLGCAGGVAAINRGAELVKATGKPMLVVAMELCSLSFDVGRALDASQGTGHKKAMVAAALFADGCAAALLVPTGPGPFHVAGASHLFPDTERVMGWDVEDHNLDVVLSPKIPHIVRENMAGVLEPLLRDHNGGRAPDAWILHPGGAKVIDAYREALGLHDGELGFTEAVLARHGNMSSPTVLFVLKEALDAGALKPGRTALLAALGPGFASELALLRAS